MKVTNNLLSLYTCICVVFLCNDYNIRARHKMGKVIMESGRMAVQMVTLAKIQTLVTVLMLKMMCRIVRSLM